jgi:hypothetical protein
VRLADDNDDDDDDDDDDGGDDDGGGGGGGGDAYPLWVTGLLYAPLSRVLVCWRMSGGWPGVDVLYWGVRWAKSLDDSVRYL